MTPPHVFFLWFLFICGLKLVLQVRWARELHARHGAAYSYGFVFRKVGRAPFGKFVIPQDLDPAFREDLRAIQARSAQWDTALCIVTVVGFVAWFAFT